LLVLVTNGGATMIRLSTAACCLVMASTAAVPHRAAAEPLVKRNIVHYDVSGATAEEIRANLNRLGPMHDVEKRRRDAHTRWSVKWTYRYRNVGNDCAIARVTTTVEVTITMPRLKADPSRPPALARTFEEYAGKLLLHEDGHAQNGIDIARRIEAAMLEIKPHPTCDALGRAANALGNLLIKEAAQKDADYDASTRHGETQGARFP
jgi:predicted secreted Zn-dependent protease